jgi:hypothetical protein
MKDQFLLLICALACAAAAWAFWHFLGADAANIISVIAVLSLGTDNVRLRAKIRDMERNANISKS